MDKNFDDIGIGPLIPEYPYGSDITIINTMYKKPARKKDSKGYDDGSITIVYHDNQTGEIKHHTIINPPYVFYYSNDIDPHDPEEYNRLYIERELVYQQVVPYKDLDYTIASMNDELDAYKQNIRNGERWRNKGVHTAPNIFNSDMDINNHIRALFDKMYTNNPVSLKKSFFDIEVDSIHMAGDFPEPGECPVNALSFLDDNTKTVHTFILRNDKNPLIEEFEKSLSPALFNELRSFVINAVGGEKKAKKFGVFDLNYEMHFFDVEIDLLRTFYRLVHKLKPMFLLAWNNAFDTPYIVERIKVLGYNPDDIMCDKDFEVKFVSYFKDDVDRKTEGAKDYWERCDFYNVAMDTVILDQMIQFASRRKSSSTINSYRLDDIGEMLVGVRKLDYSHITSNIAMLPYLDFKTFIFYNVMDVIVQKCIESKAQDMEYIFNKCLINNTMYCKGHRQTIYLVNRFTKEFAKDNYIMGNNANLGNEKERIRGALVGNPENTDDYAKRLIRGVPSMIVDNLVDFDYKSMHPSMTLQNNMSPNVQIGVIQIPEQIYKYENRFGVEVWHRQEDFAEAITTQNIIILCNRWFKLANYQELIGDVVEYFQKRYDYNIIWNVMQPAMRKQFRNNDAVVFHENWKLGNYANNAVAFHTTMPDMSNEMRELRRTVKVWQENHKKEIIEEI